MIFKRLSLKNFMSYSDAEIDFAGISTACLCGENGAGKSSLLDSIAWTIWEEGRAKTDELIKLGKEEMSCELEFYMEDDCYRIYRSRTKGKKGSAGKSNLEFQIYNQSEKSWISISRHTIKQTQELINSTLKMDYNTFVNSVYLKQGKADEFTVQGPSERKQILADILNLNFYDALCEKSREKIREIEKNILVEETFINQLEEKVKPEESLKIRLEELSQDLNNKHSNLVRIKKVLLETQKDLNEKNEKKRQLETIVKSIFSHKSLISTLENQKNNLELKIQNCLALIENKDEVASTYSKYQECKIGLEQCEKSREKYQSLTENKNLLEKELKEKIQQIEKELAVYKSKITDRTNLKREYENKLQEESLFNNETLPKAQKIINNFFEKNNLLKALEFSGQEIKHKNNLIENEINALGKKKIELEKKIHTLHAHHGNEPCPLCKSQIKDKALIVDEYNFELGEIGNQIARLNIEKESISHELESKRDEYIKIKKEIDDYPKLIKSEFDYKISYSDSRGVVNALSSHLEMMKNDYELTRNNVSIITKELDTYTSESHALSNLITTGAFVQDLSSKIKMIDSDIKLLGYDAEYHNNLRKLLKENENIVIEFDRLQEAQKNITDYQDELLSLKEKIDTGNLEIKSLSSLSELLTQDIKGIDVIVSKVSELLQEEINKQKEHDVILREKVLNEKSLEDIKLYKKSLESKKEEIKNSLEDKKQYEILEKAFSKNGLQIAIIETVVPEIEKEANRILSRLTDNQMHVALVTQKEKKTGKGFIETLDVIIADLEGTRNYELYSGGEAFKISFALRLALSRLLANRAGAKLQTLIIDEGFGSQDAAGKERLVEIIKSIQNEFELILVVTHLEELKDAFSCHIQVNKDDTGSHVMIAA